VPPIQRSTAANRLLEALPDSDRRRMLAGCETVHLAFADVLYAPGDAIKHVYFPTGSFISLIMPIDESASLEVGMVGDEGMFGTPLALDVDTSPVRAVVQGEGPALRMEAARFRRVASNADFSCTWSRRKPFAGCHATDSSLRRSASLSPSSTRRAFVGSLRLWSLNQLKIIRGTSVADHPM